jgi:flagellar motor switch protein FliN/FliY|tara:strand:- start:202 stop:570 length:369 start_codon:yes stop_codon:yes gene_type:complete
MDTQDTNEFKAETESQSQELGGALANTADNNAREHNSRNGNVDSAVLDNIPVTVSVELGTTKLKIGEMMALNQGSVIALDSLAGEPLNLRVNGTLIAKGEIVLIKENYGIKLTEIVPRGGNI